MKLLPTRPESDHVPSATIGDENQGLETYCRHTTLPTANVIGCSQCANVKVTRVPTFDPRPAYSREHVNYQAQIRTSVTSIRNLHSSPIPVADDADRWTRPQTATEEQIAAYLAAIDAGTRGDKP